MSTLGTSTVLLVDSYGDALQSIDGYLATTVNGGFFDSYTFDGYGTPIGSVAGALNVNIASGNVSLTATISPDSYTDDGYGNPIGSQEGSLNTFVTNTVHTTVDNVPHIQVQDGYGNNIGSIAGALNVNVANQLSTNPDSYTFDGYGNPIGSQSGSLDTVVTNTVAVVGSVSVNNFPTKIDGYAHDGYGNILGSVAGALDVHISSGDLSINDGGGSVTVDGSVAVSNFPALQKVDGYIDLYDGYNNPIGSQSGSLNTTVTNTVHTTVDNIPHIQLQDGYGINIGSVAGALDIHVSSGDLSVNDGGGSLTVDGYVDSRLRDGYNNTIGSSGGSLFTQVTNTVPISGTVAVNNFPALQKVDGYIDLYDGYNNPIGSQGGSLDTFVTNTVAVTGSVSVSNFPALQKVDGYIDLYDGYNNPIGSAGGSLFAQVTNTVPVSGSVSVNNFPALQKVDGYIDLYDGYNNPIGSQSGSLNTFVTNTVHTTIDNSPHVQIQDGYGVNIGSVAGALDIHVSSGDLSVNDGGNSLTIDGYVDARLRDGYNNTVGSSGGSLFTQITNTVPITGAVNVSNFPALQKVDGYIDLYDGYNNPIGSQGGSLNTTVTNTVHATIDNVPSVKIEDGYGNNIGSVAGALNVHVSSGDLSVNDGGSSLTIDGYVDARLRDGYNNTIGSSGGSLFTQVTNTVPVNVNNFPALQKVDGYIDIYDGYNNPLGSQGGSLNAFVTNTVHTSVDNTPHIQVQDGYGNNIGSVTGGLNVRVLNGTTSIPLRIDPVGTTAQPVTDNGSSLTIDGYVDSRLRDGYNNTIGSQGGSLFTFVTNTVTTSIEDGYGNPIGSVAGAINDNIASWLGSKAPTVGQKVMASSIPVTLSSDQSALKTTSTGISDFVSANQMYVVSITANLTSSGVANPALLLRNPSGSGKTMFMWRISAGINITNVEAEFKTFADPTVTANGTSQTPASRNVGGGAPASVVLASTLPTTTSNGTELSVLVSAQNNNSVVFSDEFSLAINPNHAILITGNPASNNRIASITAIWLEK